MNRMNIKKAASIALSYLIFGLYSVTWYVGALQLGGSSTLYVLILLFGLAAGSYTGATVRSGGPGTLLSRLTMVLGASGLLIFLVGGIFRGFYLMAFLGAVTAGAILAVSLRSASSDGIPPEHVLVPALGAVASGIIAAPFMVPGFGMMRLGFFGAVVCFLAGIMSRGDGTALDRSPVVGRTYRPVMISGVMAGALLASWVRFLVPVMGPSIYTFSMVSGAVLLGMGPGMSMGMAAWKAAVGFLPGLKGLKMGGPMGPAGYFKVHALLAVSALVLLPIFARMDHLYIIIRNSQEGFLPLWGLLFISLLAVLLVPSGLMGIGLVAGARGAMKGAMDGSYPGVMPVAIAGGMAGYLISSYLIIPYLGGAMAVPLAALAAGGMGYLLLPEQGAKIGARGVGGAIVIGLLAANVNMGAYGTGIGVYHLPPMINSSVYNSFLDVAVPVYREEGPSGLAVVTDTGGVETYWMDGYPVGSGEGVSDGYYMGMIPIILHPGPEKVLVAGVGDGGPVQAAEDFGMAVDVVDPNPMYEGLQGSGYILANNRIEKGSPRRVRERYDVIVSYPVPPWRADYGGLYTLDYYREVRGDLLDGGIFCQGLPAWAISDEDLFTHLQTIGSAFPEVMVFYSDSIWIVVASEDPITWDYQRMLERIGASGATSRSGESREDTAEQVIGRYVLDREMLQDIQEVPLNTDDRPVTGFALARGMAYPSINGSYQALLNLLAPRPPYIITPPLENMVSLQGGGARIAHLGLELLIGPGWDVLQSGYSFQVGAAPHYFTRFGKRASFVKGEDYMYVQETPHQASEVRGAMEQMFQQTSYSILTNEPVTVGMNHTGHLVEGRAPAGVRSSVMIGWFCPGNEAAYLLAVDYLEERPDIESIAETIKCPGDP